MIIDKWNTILKRLFLNYLRCGVVGKTSNSSVDIFHSSSAAGWQVADVNLLVEVASVLCDTGKKRFITLLESPKKIGIQNSSLVFARIKIGDDVMWNFDSNRTHIEQPTQNHHKTHGRKLRNHSTIESDDRSRILSFNLYYKAAWPWLSFPRQRSFHPWNMRKWMEMEVGPFTRSVWLYVYEKGFYRLLGPVITSLLPLYNM